MDFENNTIKMLEYINSHKVDSARLEKKFGATYRLRLNELQNGHAINFEFEPDGTTHTIVLSREGLYALENYKTSRARKWRERIISFISGAITATIPWLLAFLIGRAN